jgi:hypothetical protein
MVPLLPPVNCVEDSWGWWLHATSASGRRAPATEHIWMPKSTLGLLIELERNFGLLPDIYLF